MRTRPWIRMALCLATLASATAIAASGKEDAPPDNGLNSGSSTEGNGGKPDAGANTAVAPANADRSSGSAPSRAAETGPSQPAIPAPAPAHNPDGLRPPASAAATSQETFGGGQKKPDSDYARERGGSPTSKEKGTSNTPGALSNSEGDLNSTDTVKVRVAKLDEEGDRKASQGAVTVAIGITELSEAEGRKVTEGDTPEVQQARTEALNTLGQGLAEVDKGRQVVNHANAVRKNENRMLSLGASGGLEMHRISAGEQHLNTEEKEKLQQMEEKTGVSSASLFQAVNSGTREDIVQLAGGAQNVSLSPSEMLAAVPTFTPSSAAPSTGFPSAPTIMAGGSSFPSYSKSGESMEKVSGSARRAGAGERRLAAASFSSSQKESLQPLDSVQLFSNVAGTDSFSGNEYGDPDNDLFQRVRRQYRIRGVDLVMKSQKAL